MKKYWVNKNTNTNPRNDHEVHHNDCRLLPMIEAIDLGYHPNCQSAVSRARQHFSKVDGCVQCCPECHHG